MTNTNQPINYNDLASTGVGVLTASPASGSVYTQQITGLVAGNEFNSIAINVSTPAGSVRVKVYDDSAGAPNNLLAESGSLPVLNKGFNYFPLNKAGIVPANGIVWIGYETNSGSTLVIFGTSVVNGVSRVGHGYGAGPNPFGTPILINSQTSMKLSSGIVIRESVSKAIGKSISDSIGVQESVTDTVNLQKLVESDTITDTVTKGIGKAISDSPAITDSASASKNVKESILDSSTITDTITESRAVTRKVRDDMSFTDSIFSNIQNAVPSRPSNVKAAILTYANDGSISSRKIINTLLSAEVNKDGERAVDTATFDFPIQTSVKEGNGILYIQDIADVSFLRGIWNFHYNILDEGGSDLDGTSANESKTLYDTNVIPLNFLGLDNFGGTNFIARGIFVAGDQITVSNANNTIDFSGQFDIMVWFSILNTADSNTNAKYILDTVASGNQGISIYLPSATNQHINVDMYNGGVLTNITGTVTVNDEKWHFCRVVRNNIGEIRLYIDGVQDGSTANSTSSFQNNGGDVTFGTTSASVAGRIMNGCLLQMRIYCGGYLTDTDANNVFSYQPQPYTMKFGGIVWKIDDGTSSKTVQCKSFAKALGDIQLSFNNLVTSSGSPPTSPYIAHNVYVGKKADQILQNIITNVLSGWVFMFIPSTTTTITKYVASGSLLTNIFYLLYTESATLTFFSTARKVLIIEASGKDHTSVPGALNFIGVKAGGKYDITTDGLDDTAYINDVQVTGSLATASFHETDSPGVGILVSKVLQFAPVSATVQVPAGTYLKMDNSTSPAANTFQIDTENKQIIFSTAPNPSTVVIDYTYEDTTSLVWRNTDATGVTKNGRYNKQYNIIQLKDYFAMRSFAAHIIDRFGNDLSTHTMSQRIKINAPTLVNNIRENYKVNITSGIKGSTYPSLFNNIAYTIKQITWKYPEGKTTIQLGDYMYDFYDILGASSVSIDQNTQSYTRTKNL